MRKMTTQKQPIRWSYRSRNDDGQMDKWRTNDGQRKIHLSMPKRWTDGWCVYVYTPSVYRGNASDLEKLKKGEGDG
jgi:hypothetical protein